MFEVVLSDSWKQNFPGASIGMLVVSGIDNSRRDTPLEQRKTEIVDQVREKFDGFSRTDLLELDVLKAYRSYYKKFDKTYHVLQQLESVVHKGKSLPKVSPLVDANFAAELKTMVLTAGHDVDQLKLPVTIDVTDGNEEFVQMNGNSKSLKSNDMKMVDGGGVSCTIIYGQDNRSPISPKTSRALYVSYAPVGVSNEVVAEHLEMIKEHIALFAPDASFEYQEVHTAPTQ